ncbi:hypothetical protein [Methylobacterium sp. 22177]
MSALRGSLAAFQRDARCLTPADALIVALTPAAAFVLGVLVVFPGRFWA